MSREKITINIALISDAENLDRAKNIIQHFAQEEGKKVNSNPPYVLQNFDFNDTLINIIEIPTDENQIDTFLNTHGIKSFDATISAIPIPNAPQKSETSQLERDKETTPREEIKAFSNLFINQLNNKLDRRGGVSKTLILSTQQISESSTEKDKRLSNNDAAVRETLIEIIEAKKGLQTKPSTESISQKSESNNLQKNIHSNETLKPLPWYKKSKVGLAACAIAIIASAALFTAFALTGLLLTFWIILPIFFLVAAVGAGIKIGYDNRASRSALTTQVADNSSSTRRDLLEKTDAHASTKSSNLFLQAPSNEEKNETRYTRQDANQASEKLKSILKKFNKTFEGVNADISIKISRDDGSGYFLVCEKDSGDTFSVKFSECEKILSQVLGSDVRLDHILPSQVPELTDDLVRQVEKKGLSQ